MPPRKRWKSTSTSSSESSANASSETLDLHRVIFEFATRLLSRRDYSSAELERILSLRFASPSHVSSALARLTDLGYLDDRRLAEQLLLARSQNSSWSRFRLEAELLRRGLSTKLVQETLSRGLTGETEQKHLVQALERKLRSLGAPLDEKKLVRLYNHLSRLGFEAEAIRRELHNRFSAEFD
ncbi:MAG: regulatory protein RecX [Acidobacteriota bacterium]